MHTHRNGRICAMLCLCVLKQKIIVIYFVANNYEYTHLDMKRVLTTPYNMFSIVSPQQCVISLLGHNK